MERQGSRSQKGPYARKEGRKSFISKMTDSFKDIMYPSWLSRGDKSTPTSKTSNNQDSPQASSSTASGQADLNNPDQQPFQSQRLGIPNGIPQTQGYPRQQPGNEPPPFQSPNLPPPISEFTSSLLPLNRLTEKSDSVLANEDTMSQRSDASKSTSGCSSMVPQLYSGRRDSGVEKRKTGDQESPGSRSPPSPGPQPKRQRLNVTLGSGMNRTWTQRFNETLNSPQPASNLKRPAFNTSLFGSPLTEDTSVLGTSFHQSSFYPGKTMYGGRSSFRSSSSQKRNKIDLNQSLPSRLSFPVKSFTKAKPRTPIVKEAVTSSTAKRILDVLDRMPTPLGDAKKIPLNVSHNWTESPSFFSKEVASTSTGPPTRRLTMGSFASISQNRQTSTGSRWVAQDNSSVKPKTTTTSTPSSFTAVGLNKEDTMQVGSELSQPSGKMRREKSYHRGSASIKPTLQEDDTIVLSPVLRTDFTLPVSATPQFNFTTPSFKPAASNSKTSDASIKPTALKFTFSSPIAETSPSNKTMSPQNIGGFKFSSPINLDKKDESPQKSSGTGQKAASGFSSNFSSPSMQMNFSTAPKPKATVNGPSVLDTNEGGFKPAGMLKTGSVMDILGGGSSSKTTPQAGSGISPKPLSSVFKQSGWNCDVCLITNKVDDSKCVACQTPKPGQKPPPGPSVQTSSKVTTSGAPSIAAMFKPSGWSCDVCLISNKDDTDKCVACQTPRPGPKKITGQSSMLSKNGVLPGNWVCNTCLIQNKAEDVLCGACKSGKSASTPKVVKQDDLMAKLKGPSGQWECEVCLIQNKSDANACVACQSSKPQKRFKHPPGDWVCDTCLVNNKENDVKCVACNYSRPGAPRTQVVPSCVKSYSISQPSGFSFPGSASTQSTKDSSNVVNTGGFKFGTATTSSSSDFKFGAPSNLDSTSKLSENGVKFGSDSSKTVPSSGFKFGVSISSSSDSSKSDNITSTGGFKFGTSVNEKLTGDKTDNKQNNDASPKAPGFQFGSATSNKGSVTQPTGDFKFGSTSSTESSATNTSTGGFQTGGNSTKSNTMGGGFKFGISTVASSTGSSEKSVSVISNSSVISSTALVNSSSDPAKTIASPGGFTLPSSGPLSSVTPLDKTSVKPSIPAVGGFNFTSSGSKDTISNNVTSSSFTGMFGGTKAPEVSAKKDIQMPVFGASSDKVANTTPTPAFGGFNFAQKKNEDPSTGITSLVNSSGKRGRDEDSGEATAKKSNISFGSSTTSTPFQFGATNNASQPNSSSFVFGQQNSTTLQAGGFNFGMNKTNDSTKSVFGGAISSTQTTSAAPQFAQTNPVFGFSGQKSEPASTNSNLFKFGGTPGTTATPAAAPSFGGVNTNSFGTTSGNVFGGNAPSTAPAFGSTPPPAFGSTNTGAVATTTPAFGGGVFQFGGDQTSSGPKPPTQTTSSLFQFGAKPAETAQQPTAAPNAGFNFNTNQAGLGGGGAVPNFNFSQSPAPAAFNFSAGATPNNAFSAGATPNNAFSAGATPNNAFSTGATPNNAFSATAAPNNAFSVPGTGERKMKKAVRKLRR